jgi:hypothetical protein
LSAAYLEGPPRRQHDKPAHCQFRRGPDGHDHAGARADGAILVGQRS